MKSLIYVLSASTIFLTSCVSMPSKKVISEKELFGETVDNKYTNTVFEFVVDLPANWKITPQSSFKSTFGGTLFHADYFDSNDVNFEAPLFSCDIKFTRINPFDRTASPLKELEDTYAALAVVYDTAQLIQQPFEKVKLAGKTFIHSSITIPEEFEYYMDEYIVKEENYFVSIIFNYYNEEQRQLVKESLKSFKQL